ncbi:hypothetical protein WN55_07102 [Dufourea novaeangliae]|nr:hypothetical protein WN55_07102 [Dufourea novaeangliae]
MYDNQRALVLRHAALLRDTPAMLDNSSESVRDLVNHVQLHIRSLQALGRNWENIANDIIASIVVSKMSEETRKTWERTLSDTDVPKIEDIFKHLHNASHQTEEYNSTAKHDLPNVKCNAKPRPIQTRSYNFRPRSLQSQSHQRVNTYVTKTSTAAQTAQPKSDRRGRPTGYSSFSQRSDWKTPKTTGRPSCIACNSGSHAEFQCRKFLEMPVAQRIDVARKATLCMNCLLPGHQSDNCIAGRCRVCNQPHNTKLHQDTRVENAESRL